MTDEANKVDNNSVVSLRPVTKETVRSILRLNVMPEQEQFVAPNAVSVAEAYFEEKAWFRAIYADETPVGFVMLYEDPDEGEYYLWRFMIDGRYQGSGFGRQALEQVIERVRALPNAREMTLSYVPADGGPELFYAGLGFVNTGEMHDDEMVMKLKL